MAKQGKIYSKVGAVDMSSNDGDASSTLPVFRECEGDQGTLIPREIIFSTLVNGGIPVIFLSDLSETGFL